MQTNYNRSLDGYIETIKNGFVLKRFKNLLNSNT
jgi:hypothetical protein